MNPLYAWGNIQTENRKQETETRKQKPENRKLEDRAKNPAGIN